jgi:hypothetical protein
LPTFLGAIPPFPPPEFYFNSGDSMEYPSFFDLKYTLSVIYISPVCDILHLLKRKIVPGEVKGHGRQGKIPGGNGSPNAQIQ